MFAETFAEIARRHLAQAEMLQMDAEQFKDEVFTRLAREAQAGGIREMLHFHCFLAGKGR